MTAIIQFKRPTGKLRWAILHNKEALEGSTELQQEFEITTITHDGAREIKDLEVTWEPVVRVMI